MARSTTPWIGKTDDSKPPAHVVLRIWRREDGKCHITGRKIGVADKWELEHVIALSCGGKNVESNLAPALIDPHKSKTAEDVATKAKIDAVAKRHAGIRHAPARKIKSAGFPPSGKVKHERVALPPKRLFAPERNAR